MFSFNIFVSSVGQLKSVDELNYVGLTTELYAR